MITEHNLVSTARWFSETVAILNSIAAESLFPKYRDTLKRDPFHIGSEIITAGHLSWVMEQDALHLPKFNWGLRAMVEGGLITKWKENILRSVASSGGGSTKESQEKPLSLSHFAGIYFLLLFGILMSSIIFALELSK